MANRRAKDAICGAGGDPDDPHHDPDGTCPIEVSLRVIGGMWKIVIIRELSQGTRRYSQLHRALAGVTHKMLTQQLRELERDGVVVRTVYPEVPPRVEYSLTPLGRRVRPLLLAMKAWGEQVIARAREAGTLSDLPGSPTASRAGRRGARRA
jgi:DNA-binding HxlR family transcriptional regulator